MLAHEHGGLLGLKAGGVGANVGVAGLVAPNDVDVHLQGVETGFVVVIRDELAVADFLNDGAAFLHHPDPELLADAGATARQAQGDTGADEVAGVVELGQLLGQRNDVVKGLRRIGLGQTGFRPHLLIVVDRAGRDQARHGVGGVAHIAVVADGLVKHAGVDELYHVGGRRLRITCFHKAEEEGRVDRYDVRAGVCRQRGAQLRLHIAEVVAGALDRHVGVLFIVRLGHLGKPLVKLRIADPQVQFDVARFINIDVGVGCLAAGRAIVRRGLAAACEQHCNAEQCKQHCQNLFHVLSSLIFVSGVPFIHRASR